MPQFCLDSDVISKKKVLEGKMPPFSQDLPQKKSSVFHILIFQCHFDGSSAGPPEANRPHDGPPHGPRGHGPLCPPSRRPCFESKLWSLYDKCKVLAQTTPKYTFIARFCFIFVNGLIRWSPPHSSRVSSEA